MRFEEMQYNFCKAWVWQCNLYHHCCFSVLLSPCITGIQRGKTITPVCLVAVLHIYIDLFSFLLTPNAVDFSRGRWLWLLTTQDKSHRKCRQSVIMEKCSGNMGYIITGYNNSLQERQCLYIVRKKSIIATQTTKGALWSIITACPLQRRESTVRKCVCFILHLVLYIYLNLDTKSTLSLAFFSPWWSLPLVYSCPSSSPMQAARARPAHWAEMSSTDLSLVSSPT